MKYDSTEVPVEAPFVVRLLVPGVSFSSSFFFLFFFFFFSSSGNETPRRFLSVLLITCWAFFVRLEIRSPRDLDTLKKYEQVSG